MKKDIIELLEETFVDYAAPILCNNLPSIDGLLPVNRKVIWGMNDAKITHDKPFSKMLRATGYILPYYTFGDDPLTSAMKNMGNNSININYLIPKGAFGDKRRKDAEGAKARYIECKLSEYAEDMLKGINKNAVSMKRNYDNTKDEPVILPSKYPNILINTSQSIAVGESSKIPSHNVNEICDSFIEYIRTENIDKAIEYLNGADFSIGGQIINDRKNIEKIYKTGKGSFELLGKYTYNEESSELIIYEVPYESYIENIENEIRENVEKGIFKEVVDTHDATDKDGLKLIVYLRKNTDIDKFILKLRKHTSFQKSFSCNFTILDLDGKTPKLMNLEEIIKTWRKHRRICIKNELEYDIKENNTKLNKLYGLQKISSNLDEAINIIRNSKKESEAIDNLKNKFNLNIEQCEYITTIRLLNINKEWINKYIKHIDELEAKNIKINKILNDEIKIDRVIIKQLEECKEKYGIDRRTTLFNVSDTKKDIKESLIDDYNCILYLTKECYFKKVRAVSNKGNNKLKDGDEIKTILECSNKDELLVFGSDLCCYKFKLYELEETKLSNLGLYLNKLINCEVLGISVLNDKNKFITVIYKNNKVAKVDLKSFETKQNRNKLAKSLNNNEVFDILTFEDSDKQLKLIVTDGREKIINLNEMTTKSSRSTQGINVYTWKNQDIIKVEVIDQIQVDK